jgi:hypothetical protein
MARRSIGGVMPKCNFNITDSQDLNLSALAKSIGTDRSALVRIALDAVMPVLGELAEAHDTEKMIADRLREMSKGSIRKPSAKRAK